MPCDSAASTAPNFRATILPRRITLVTWGPWLAAGVTLLALLRQRGPDSAMIADLRVLEDDRGLARDLVVDVVCGDTVEGRACLLRWASAVGYGRVWLPDEVIEIADDTMIGGVAHTRCRSCSASLVSDGADFWVTVRCVGAFPTTCPVCGGDLPQASVRRRSASRASAHHRRSALVADSSRR